MLLKRAGGKPGIPPNWEYRERLSRRARQKDVAKVLKTGKVADVATLEEWELVFRKECFYHGMRCLFDLERKGKTRL